MPESSLYVLSTTAFVVALTHTLVGVDHYLPFVVMGRAHRWSTVRLVLVTALCGLGHVLSSIALGFVGIGLGIAVGTLEGVEAERGELASLLLIAFGLAYAVWGLRRAYRGRRHSHAHHHVDGCEHEHDHDHSGAHRHAHAAESTTAFWALFVIFVLGPCEPLIPLVMVPAAHHSTAGVVVVAFVFGAVTIATMLTMTLLLSRGLRLVRIQRLERYSHALAGAAIMVAGLLIAFVGI